MSKKLRLIGIVMVMSTLVLTACGNSKEESSKKETEEVTEVVKDVETEEAQIEEANEEKVLVIATPGQHYPWNYMEDGELKGLDIDILREVGKRIGYEVEFEISEFSGIFGLIDNGKVATGACQISKTPERIENYTFSDEYAYTYYKLVVEENNEDINSIKDLVGKTFVGQPAKIEVEVMEDYIEKNNLDGEIEMLITDADPFMEISLGRADATFFPEIMFGEKKSEGDFKVKMVGDTVGEEAHAYPFNKDVDPEFLKEFNKALADMKADGFLADLYKERFNIDISESQL